MIEVRTHYDVTVQHINHYARETPHTNILVEKKKKKKENKKKKQKAEQLSFKQFLLIKEFFKKFVFVLFHRVLTSTVSGKPSCGKDQRTSLWMHILHSKSTLLIKISSKQ